MKAKIFCGARWLDDNHGDIDKNAESNSLTKSEVHCYVIQRKAGMGSRLHDLFGKD